MLEEMKDRSIESLTEEYFEYLIDTLERDNKTKLAYEINLKCFIKHTECKTLEDLNNMTYPILQKIWLKPLKDRGLKGATINQRIATLASFYEYLNAMEYLEKNPAAKVKKVKVDKKVYEKEMLNDAAIIQLINKAEEVFENEPTYENIRNLFFIHILISTGMRISEITNMKITDIEDDYSFIVVGKRKIERRVIMNDFVIKIYKQYFWYRKSVKVKDNNEDSLFITRLGTSPTIKSMGNILEKLLIIAEVDKVGCHSFRHKFISSMHDNGHSLDDIAKITGHQNLNTIYGTYLHKSNDNAKELVNDHVIYSKLINN